MGTYDSPYMIPKQWVIIMKMIETTPTTTEPPISRIILNTIAKKKTDSRP